MKRFFVIVLTLLLLQPAQAQMTLRGAGRSSESGGSSLLTGIVSFWKLSDLSDSAGSNSLTNNGGVTFALAQDRKMSRGAGGVGSGSAGSTLLTNLISYWKLSDLSDSSGSSTLASNGTVTFAPGKIGNAASFNGTTQWLSVADNTSLSTGDVSFQSLSGCSLTILQAHRFSARSGADRVEVLTTNTESTLMVSF